MFDLKSEYLKSKKTKNLYLFTYILVMLFLLIGIALLLLFLKNIVVLQRILLTILISLMGICSLAFFTIVFEKVNNDYKFLDSAINSDHIIENVEFIKQSNEICLINGVYAYPFYVRYVRDINCQDVVMFTLNKYEDLKMGDQIQIETFQKIVVKVDVNNE